MGKEQSPHVRRAIAVPFTPTIGCRINFNNVPLESLTPCTLLAKQLVFSPAPESQQQKQHQQQMLANATPKKPECELSVISEESLDIIAELDCYQLELENSINEAKMAKRGRRSSGKNLMDLKNCKSFAMMLSQGECGANGDGEQNVSMELAGAKSNVDLAAKLTPKLHAPEVAIGGESAAQLSTDHSGVDYEEVEETSDLVNGDQSFNADSDNDADGIDFQFKNPAPFVRTFKRKSIRRPIATSMATENAVTAPAEKPSTGGIRHSIRNSIRRLIKAQPKKAVSADHVNEINGGDDDGTDATTAPRIFATLRQSLRRKPKQSELPERYDHDVSILCDTERPVFRQLPPQHRLKTTSADNLGVRKGAASLRSSIRNTTKNVKSMFKKNAEEYEFE